jgi:hypothetical protein
MEGDESLSVTHPLESLYYFAFLVLPLSPQLALLASVGGERGPMPIPLRGI